MKGSTNYENQYSKSYGIDHPSFTKPNLIYVSHDIVPEQTLQSLSFREARLEVELKLTAIRRVEMYVTEPALHVLQGWRRIVFENFVMHFTAGVPLVFSGLYRVKVR